MSPWNLLDNNFFTDFSITFRHYYHEKQMFLTSSIWLIFLRFLLSHEVMTFQVVARILIMEEGGRSHSSMKKFLESMIL